MEEIVLGLDISTKTGWSVAKISKSEIKLIEYGQIPKTTEPEGKYPSNYVIWAYQVFEDINKLIIKYKPTVLVIEETSKGSKNAMSQKILEFSHFLLAQYIKDNDINSVYIQTEAWRREIGCQMTKEEKDRNKEVRQYKKKNKTNIAYDKSGKRTGLITKKHVTIRIVNEIFGDQLPEKLRKREEDLADSLGLIAAYYFRQQKQKSKEVTLEDLIKE